MTKKIIGYGIILLFFGGIVAIISCKAGVWLALGLMAVSVILAALLMMAVSFII